MIVPTKSNIGAYFSLLNKKGYTNLIKISTTANVYKGTKNNKEFSISVKISDKKSRNWKLIFKTVHKLKNYGIQVCEPTEVFNLKNKDIIICEYINGTSPDDSRLNNYIIELFEKITKIPMDRRGLKNITKNHEYYYKSKYISHLKAIVKNNKKFEHLAKKLLPYGDYYSLSISDLSYQHCDLHAKNIIHSTKDDQDYLIDINSVGITSKYFDSATFIAKSLDKPMIVRSIYFGLKNKLNKNEFNKFNLQLIFAIIKEYKNLFQLSKEESNLPVFKKSSLLIYEKINNIVNRIELAKTLDTNIF